MTFKAPSGPGPVPRTPLGLSGLGAVGGPRGVGAGALRIIVEFLTQYDAEAVKKLESDLNKLQGRQAQLAVSAQSQTQQLAAQQGVRTRIANLQDKFTSAELKSIKQINELQKTGTRDNLKLASQQVAAFQGIAKARGLSKGETTLLLNADTNLEKAAARELAIRKQINATRAKTTQVAQQQVQTEKQLTGLQSLKAGLAPKLGGLALGALGGIAGGAILGVGFTLAQAGLEAIGGAIQDIIDPARHAREELDDIAQAINKISASEGITLIAAAAKEVRDLGAFGEGLNAALLGEAAALDDVNKKLELRAKLLDIQKNFEALLTEAIQKRERELVKEAGLQPALRGRGSGTSPELAAARERIHAQAVREVTVAMGQADTAASRLAASELREAQAAAFASVQQRNLASILNTASNLGTTGIQDQLDALNTVGPSARTKALEASLEAMQDSSGGVASALQSISEQQALLLFQQKLLTQDVNPASVSGEFKLAAIDARIAKINEARDAEQDQTQAIDDQIASLQKAADAQDKFNRLLDIQFKLSKPAIRQQGETISDFIQRRAQETRQLLAEQAKLTQTDRVGVLQAEKDKLQAVIDRHEIERQAEIRALEEERKSVELSVQLAKLAEQRKQVLADAGRAARVKQLQEALKDSQANDAAVIESRRKALQAQLTKEQDFWARVEEYSDTARIKEISAAISFSNTMQKLLTVSGEVAGAKFAAAQLRQLLMSGLVPPAQLPAIYAVLKSLDSLAAQYQGRLNSLTSPRYGGKISGFQETAGFAEGGVFPLRNSNSPVGSNIKWGEQGQEMGMVLSNKVTEALRSSQHGEMIGEINLVTQDPLRDEYTIRRIIREEVQRSLR